jgi:nifR3 family TIM-barrel protein
MHPTAALPPPPADPGAANLPAPCSDPLADPQRYIHPLRIGSLQLSNNLCLAPMAGFTNVAFRLIAKEVGGCGLVASEMVAAIGPNQHGGEERFRVLTRNVAAEKPLAMQVYGRDPALCGATAAALERAGADLIDLNCGCPVKKAKQSGCGVALMREPELVGRIIKAMCEATTRPVTVKIRLGFDAANRTMVEVASAAVENGAQAIFVHARTGESKHGVAVDLSGVAEVKQAVLRLRGTAVPVIANGSLDTAPAIRAARDQAGADGYQIGRAACGDPWLFRNLLAELTGMPTYTPAPEERRALLRRHYQLICDLFGPQRGTRVMRKYTFFYCNGLPGVRRFRERFHRIASADEFHAVVDDFFANLGAGAAAHEPSEHLSLFEKGGSAADGEEGD